MDKQALLQGEFLTTTVFFYALERHLVALHLSYEPNSKLYHMFPKNHFLQKYIQQDFELKIDTREIWRLFRYVVG